MRSLLSFLGFGRRRPPRRRIATRPVGVPPRRFERSRYDARYDARPDASRPRERVSIAWRTLAAWALGGLTTAAVAYGAFLLFTGDTFRAQDVQVTGHQVTAEADILRAAGVAGASMFALDAERVREAVVTLPAVRSVTVARDWPQGVAIEVVEHQAWGYWQSGSQRLVIDAEGHVLQASRPPAEEAPTIIELAPEDGGEPTDPDTVHLVDRLHSEGVFERLQVRPTGYFFRRDRGLTVMVEDGPAALFGDSSNYEFKVQAWASVVEEQHREGSPVRAAMARAVEAAGEDAAGDEEATLPEGGEVEGGAVSEIDLRFGRNVVLR